MDVEKILPLEDSSCGLRGFIVIHGTARGPATGGIRLYPYASDEAARTDGSMRPTFSSTQAPLSNIQGVRFLLEGERRSPEAISTIGVKTTQLLEKARDQGIPPEVLLEEDTRKRLELGSS